MGLATSRFPAFFTLDVYCYRLFLAVSRDFFEIFFRIVRGMLEIARMFDFTIDVVGIWSRLVRGGGEQGLNSPAESQRKEEIGWNGLRGQ
jgi:hypothetical protein